MTLKRLLMALALCPAAAYGAGTIHVESVDFVKAWFKARHAVLGADAAKITDEGWSTLLLKQGPLPTDAYADVETWDPSMRDDAWAMAIDAVSRDDAPVTDAMALWMVQWDMGFTKARPGVDVGVVNDGRGYGDGLTTANAVKAGVKPEYFHQALAIFGHDHSTIAAKMAVAVQILDDRAARTPPDRDDVRHVRRDVLERFMALPEGHALDEYDAHYLVELLKSELDRHTAGRRSATGERELATPYRIARVAAAYRNMQGFVTAPCDAMGRRIRDVASADPRSGAAMCFTDAHDRAVFAWYNEEFRRQAIAIRRTPHHMNGAAALLTLLAPFGLVFDALAAAEFTEALMADDLATAGELSVDDAALYEDRMEGLTCRAL